MNIDYSIHRYGEWTMLMLGETVLSLLIVGVYVQHEFYKTVYSGILTIAILQILHFRSQPHHADDHAMRRKKERGYAFTIMQQLYSACLIILGASYKMLLYEYVYENDYAVEAGYASYTDTTYGGSTGYGIGASYAANETAYGHDASYSDAGHRRLMAFGSKLHRLLAGGGGGALRFDKDDRLQRVANLFCGSMALIYLLCDLMVIIHKGIAEHLQQCKEKPTSKLAKLLGIPLFLIRVGLIVFMATLSQYLTEPSTMAFIGLLGAVVQVILRIVGSTLYRDDSEEDDPYRELLKHGFEGEKSMAFQPEDSESSS